MMTEDLTPEQKQERVKLIMECMCLAYLFQESTDHAVFINYSGHVDSLSIQICESKINYNKELAETTFYTDGKFRKDTGDVNYWLKVKRDVLKESLDNREIETDSMSEVVTKIYSYEF